jgi:transposase
MAERQVEVDRETAMLLPVNMRDWVPEDDLVHFVIAAVESMNLSSFSVNERGSGSKQYPPHMMAELLIYCYSNDLFSSRRIERATYRDVAVRYLTGNTHPDHDTICKFRRENAAVFREAFLEVLHLAVEMKFLKVGTISIDGTHIKANASKHKSVRYDRLQQLEQQLSADIDELLERAEQADRNDEIDGQSIPKEIARRQQLHDKLSQARKNLEARKAGPQSEQSSDGNEQDGPESGTGETGQHTKPKDSDQINLVDPDSGLMRKSKRDGYQQAYNAQVAVDAEGSQLILATDVLQTPSDANELIPMVEQVEENLGPANQVLADGGYLNAAAIEEIEGRGIEAYVAISDEAQNVRQYDYRPPKERKGKKVKDRRLVAMREKLRTNDGRRTYAKRARTVEPVFGIIKAPMGFRQFLLRGIEKVQIEWDLVCIAYNMRRLHSIIGALRTL